MLRNKTVRGTESQKELTEEYLTRDTRSQVGKFFDWLRSPSNLASAILGLAVLPVVFPGVGDLGLLVGLSLAGWGMLQKEHAPLKLPKQSGLPDYNQINPATKRPTRADGIYYLGKEQKTGKELWLTNSDCRQHFLVFGTTGSGKTEMLFGFCANALCWQSGFLFCDGKADVAVFGKVYAMVRRFGREDDLLVLNFMTGNRDISSTGDRMMSNTINALATGSSDSLVQMITSLMQEAGGDSAMWKARAVAMLTAVMRVLVWLREKNRVDLNMGTLREYINLPKMIDLANKEKYPDMPPEIRDIVKNYLLSIPGFREDKGYEQSNTTNDQHGYLVMQFTQVLGSMADVYGYIFNSQYGDVDMFDVVTGRRILFIMLPSLEKSKDETANLGKIAVSLLKGMMGATLGGSIQGNHKELFEGRVTDSITPYIVIMDEVGYYMAEGMAMIAAQSRSLGFCNVYATQDLPSMTSVNEREADSVVANANTKIVMAIVDSKTTEFVIKLAGRALRAMGAFQGHSGEMGVSYRDSLEGRVEAADRIDLRDLQSQRAGEAHVLREDKVVRTETFYTNPPDLLDMKALAYGPNHLIPVPKPSSDDIERAKRVPNIIDKMADAKHAKSMKADAEAALAAVPEAARGGDEIAVVAQTLAAMKASRRMPLEASCAAYARLQMVQEGDLQVFAQAVGTASRVLDDLGGSRRAGRPSSDPYSATVRDDPLLVSMAESHAVDFDEDDIPDEDEDELPVFDDRRPADASFGGDVDHEIAIDGGDVFRMADDISRNDSGFRALLAMDRDPDVDGMEGSEEDFEAAVALHEGLDDDFDADEPPAPKAAIAEAAASVSRAGDPTRAAAPDPNQRAIEDFLTSLFDDQDQ